MTLPPVGDAALAALVVSIVLIGLAVWEALGAERWGRVREAWEELERLLVSRGVDAASAERLVVWTRQASPEEPLAATRSREVFDRFVRDSLQQLDRRDVARDALERRELRVAIATLRKGLGFDSVPDGSPLVSSREVLTGTRLALRADPLPEAPGTGPQRARRDAGPKHEFQVSSLDEEEILVAALDAIPTDHAPAFSPGRGVWASFEHRGAGTYRFRTRVNLRDGASSASRLSLAHGDFLIFEERRRDHRVIHRVAVTVRVAEPASELEGETVDVSRGGLGLLTKAAVARGSRVAMDLRLEAGAPLLPVSARVVSAGLTEDGRHYLHCQITELAPDARSRLGEFLRASVAT